MQPTPFDHADLTWLAGLARALLGEVHAAEDLVQDTAAAALAGGLPAGAGRRAWLASVARRLAARRFRGEARRVRREAAVAREEALPDATELVERAEVAEQVAAAVRRLPEPYRHAVLLRFLEGHSPEEIAQEVGKPADTVRWRLRRGLELLRSELVQHHDRDWSSWCVLLLPLARSFSSGGLGAGAGAQATTVGSPTTPVAATLTKTGGGLAKGLGMVMAKVALVAACVVGVVGLWTARDGARQERRTEEAAARLTPLDRAASPAPDLMDTLQRVRSSDDDGERLVLEEPEALAARESVVTTFEGLRGRVVDEEGKPVAGALVFVRRAGQDGLEGRVTTNRTGVFRLPLANPEDGASASELGALDLGVSANGYRRAFVSDVRSTRSTSEAGGVDGADRGKGDKDEEELADDMLLVRLERGRSFSGWVVDETGRPVSGLRLLAHSASAAITHVSPSKMGLRAEGQRTARQASAYEQCVVVTDDEGAVRFSGLDPNEDVVLQVMDPGFWLRDSRPVQDGTVWIVERRLGVRVQVVDAESGQPVDPVSGIFHVALTFADGGELDLGQWVGRGPGEVSWTLNGEMAPSIEDRVVTRARFYGTVRRTGEEDAQAQEWEAPVLENPLGVTGVATARVRLAPAKPVPEVPTIVDLAEAEAKQERGRALVELDVRFADGTPYDDELEVAWASRLDGERVVGEATLEPTARGLYALNVPAGEVVLQVRADNDSGTMTPWSGRWSLLAGEVALERVELPRGATATLLRPAGWSGEWYVRVSWRASEEDEWFGSWWHGTDEAELMLEVLRPAFWRFEVRRTQSSNETPLVWTTELQEGDARVVGG